MFNSQVVEDMARTFPNCLSRARVGVQQAVEKRADLNQLRCHFDDGLQLLMSESMLQDERRLLRMAIAVMLRRLRGNSEVYERYSHREST